MKILLFDIDGTLLNTHGLGRDAFESALKECLEYEGDDLKRTDWMGRTDTDILTGLLESLCKEPSEIKEILPGIFKRYVEYFREYSESHSGRFEIYDGVIDILEDLRSVNAPLGLLTGNVKDAAYIKLAQKGIDKYFPYGIGGFGDERRDRNSLFPLAEKRIKDYYHIQTAEAVVIGDSHRDIECARVNGAVSVAIANGKMSYEELREYEPDYLFKSFRDREAILKVLT